MSKGSAQSKKCDIIAFPLMDMGVITLNNSGGVETSKDISFDHHLIFDTSVFTHKEANEAFSKLFSTYAKLIEEAPTELIAKVNAGQVGVHIAAIAEGVWTMVNKNFRTDYELDEKNPNVYHAKPGTGRLCLPVDRDFKMPVQWGDFNVRKGGTIAVRFGDVPALTEALGQIKEGKAAIEEALYDKEGKAKFDIYGMDPGFLETNYAPTTLPKETADAISKFQENEESPHRPGGRKPREEKTVAELRTGTEDNQL